MTVLTGIRQANKSERDRGAEVVFTREDKDGREYTIYGCEGYESWEQWGAHTEVLADNILAIEAWRHGGIVSAIQYVED